MHKHYGQVDWFDDKPVGLFLDCLDRGIEKEMEIPKAIDLIVKRLNKEPVFEEKRNMRSAEEIMKDYGLEVIK